MSRPPSLLLLVPPVANPAGSEGTWTPVDVMPAARPLGQRAGGRRGGGLEGQQETWHRQWQQQMSEGFWWVRSKLAQLRPTQSSPQPYPHVSEGGEEPGRRGPVRGNPAGVGSPGHGEGPSLLQGQRSGVQGACRQLHKDRVPIYFVPWCSQSNSSSA